MQGLNTVSVRGQSHYSLDDNFVKTQTKSEFVIDVNVNYGDDFTLRIFSGPPLCPAASPITVSFSAIK